MLGVNGTVIKVHGRSKRKAISYAILSAANFVEHNGIERIREEIAVWVVQNDQIHGKKSKNTGDQQIYP